MKGVSHMNFDYVESFYYVAQYKSIRKAAQHLFTSSSSLSTQVKKLELELGVELLIRKSTGVELTPTGQELYTLYSQTQQMWKISHLYRDNKKIIRIGLFSEFATKTTKLLHELFQHSYLRIEMYYGGEIDLIKKLKSEDIDLLVTPHYHKELSHSHFILRKLPLIALYSQNFNPEITPCIYCIGIPYNPDTKNSLKEYLQKSTILAKNTLFNFSAHFKTLTLHSNDNTVFILHKEIAAEYHGLEWKKIDYVTETLEYVYYRNNLSRSMMSDIDHLKRVGEKNELE